MKRTKSKIIKSRKMLISLLLATLLAIVVFIPSASAHENTSEQYLSDGEGTVTWVSSDTNHQLFPGNQEYALLQWAEENLISNDAGGQYVNDLDVMVSGDVAVVTSGMRTSVSCVPVSAFSFNTDDDSEVIVKSTNDLSEKWLPGDPEPIRRNIFYVPGDADTIQEAIDMSSDGDEIIVAPDTYHEAINFFGKAVYLHSSDGPDVTIIDATGLEISVVTCESGEGLDTILEGFTITGGTGTEYMGEIMGGGMLNRSSSSPTVNNCIFSENTAFGFDNIDGLGGGMYNRYQSNPTVTNCTFSGNTAFSDGEYGYAYGGGMYNNISSPTITNCTFSGNTAWADYASGYGGGMYNNNSSNPTVTDCTFSENKAFGFDSGFGGGMYNRDNSPTITNCTFSENQATHYGAGSGMCNYYSSPIVTNCTFIGNTNNFHGGGMGNYYSSPTVTNCIFSGNTCRWSGGGMYNYDSSSTITNCTFSGNRAYQTDGYGGYGAGMYNYESTTTIVTNCTFSGNIAWETGGGIYNNQGTSAVTNCILWNNNPNQIYTYGTATVIYSCIQGGYTGQGNIDADPLFADAPSNNFRLRAGSPCIDAGDNTAVPPEIITDLDGNPRFIDDPATPDTGNGDPPIVDMGAYEFQPGDINNDGVVNVSDLLLLLAAWGTNDVAADLNGDGFVNTPDLLILLGNWS